MEALAASDEPLRLTRVDGEPLQLSVQQQYQLIETDDPDRGPWKVSTRANRYRLNDQAGRELAGWHWHPRGRSREQYPHLHVFEGPLAGLHLPTGRVSLERVLRLLLAELDVRPRRPDWKDVLDTTDAAFVEWRTWG